MPWRDIDVVREVSSLCCWRLDCDKELGEGGMCGPLFESASRSCVWLCRAVESFLDTVCMYVGFEIRLAGRGMVLAQSAIVCFFFERMGKG